MKKIILASLFIVAAASLQPAFAATGGEKGLCAKGTKLCACGKLPGAQWSCCPAAAKCSCSTGVPDCKHP
jgi:hypothetical protein